MSGSAIRHTRILSVAMMALSVLLLAAVAVVGVRLANSGAAANAAGGAGPGRDPNVDPGSPLGGGPAPDFTLTNQFGQPVSLTAERGKVVVLAFVDSMCTSICPLTTTSMLQAKAMLGPDGSRVALVGINANPTATSVSAVRAYSTAHGMINQWNFLTGTPAQLAAVWKAYHVYVAVTTTGIDHEPVLYVIDAQGRERMLYLTQMAFSAVAGQAGVLAHELSALLPGHPHVGPIPAQGSAIGPQTPITLSPVTGGPPVRLGPGHPHLILFFDTWLTETSDLTAELKALGSYTATAAAHGWPTLVAVDIGPVEASPTALSRLLHRLAGKLDYPVVVDQTGALADGFQVGGVPWIDLTSAEGKVAFSRASWLPIGALDAAVAGAVGPPH